MSTLLFIYNAKSGKLNSFFDVVYKFFSPSTYNCNLCALTFDTFTENKIWKKFREDSNLEIKFYHIDEFENHFQDANFEYPAIIRQTDHLLEPFINAENLNKIEGVDELIQLLKNRFLVSQK